MRQAIRVDLCMEEFLGIVLAFMEMEKSRLHENAAVTAHRDPATAGVTGQMS
jgi:hypothetical protein